MKKMWMNPEITALDVKETAFGIYNKEVPDSEKTQVVDAAGTLLGYKQEYGEGSAS